MGLDIACKCGVVGFRAGSYSGFHLFRCWLAKYFLCDYERYPSKTLGTPLASFFWHSDCDGDLSADLCKKMLPKFKEIKEDLILPRSRKERVFRKVFGHERLPRDEYMEKHLDDWIKAMEHSATCNCALEFC